MAQDLLLGSLTPMRVAMRARSAASERARVALHAAFDLDALLLLGGGERRVVGVGLVGVGHGEAFECTVERVVVAQVASDLCGVTGARVRACQGGSAELGRPTGGDRGARSAQCRRFDGGRGLDVR
jgi:hypothetical protein